MHRILLPKIRNRPIQKAIPALLFSLVLASGAPANEDPQGLPANANLRRGYAGRVEFGSDPEGEPWARGATYKVGFEREATAYHPFLGSRAPRNFPLALRLEGVEVGGSDVAFDRGVAPRRSERVVSFDRGTLVERYETSPDSIEQIFVFESLPRRGELELRIAVETELEGVTTADGFEFRNEHGGVRYGFATAFDARGASCSAPTTLEGGSIRIVVPESFVRNARFPLTIDPVLSTFWVDNTTNDDFAPDVAHDTTTGNYLVVYEEAFSASDHDVVATLISSSGAFLSSQRVDWIPTENWSKPRIAFTPVNPGRCLVVAVTASGVRGRIAPASTLAFGPLIVVANNAYAPDVGGRFLGTSLNGFCVVYVTRDAGNAYFLQAQSIHADANGTLSSLSTVASTATNGPPISAPAINEIGDATNWVVVWELATTTTNRDIYGRRLFSNGSGNGPEFPIDISASDDRRPSISGKLTSNTSRYLVTYEREVGPNNRNIMARLMDGSASVDFVDLSVLEGTSSSADQYAPSVDSNGSQFAVAYTEWTTIPTSDEDVYVATLTPVGDQLRLTEGHVSLSFSDSVHEHEVTIVADRTWSGPTGRFLAVWGVASGGTSRGDIEAGIYVPEDFVSFCWPGQAGVLPCPCANPPASNGLGCNNSSNTGGALLWQAGTASIANDTVLFATTGERPTPLSIVWQCTALAPAGIQFGQGVRCGTGTLKRLYTKVASGGSILAPQNGDPTVSARSAAVNDPLASGTTRYYFVSYRDPNLLGGCAPIYTFNATQTGAITWRP